MTPATANAIYDILVEECGASTDLRDREAFVRYVIRLTEPRGPQAMYGDVVEFSPLSGMATFHCTHRGDRLRVTHYSPSMVGRPEWDTMIELANARLAELEAACHA